MQAAAGGRRWLACPPRWRRWRPRCCCEVWQGWQAVGAVQVGQGWRWCVVIVGGGLLLAWSSGAALAVLILPGAGGGRNIRVLCPALPGYFPAFPRGGRRQHPARAGLLIRQAGQAAGGKAAQKKKARAAARCALLLWPSVCAGGVICCAGPDPVQVVGGGGLFPCSGAGPLLALALFQAQRFRLATFQRGTGCAGGAPSGPFLPFAGGVRFST